jgi:hypothetical protein
MLGLGHLTDPIVLQGEPYMYVAQGVRVMPTEAVSVGRQVTEHVVHELERIADAHAQCIVAQML